jgi:hypothetical protein
MRMAGLRYGLGLPLAADVAITGMPRLRRGNAKADDGNEQGNPPPEEPDSGQSTMTLPKS